ncbi:MAG: O-acetyl-ADP-ribose deacetylase [Thermoguttaceae bacterium]|jgi:O-acetyl-ADP-ribose deacetylase (regulator of RNase III)
MKKIGKTELDVEQGDITKSTTDAIVNAANVSLLGGGGVDGAIHRAAGPELLEYCRKLGGCETGEAKITPGFNLPARYVIHTPGPVWAKSKEAQCDELLRNSYYNSLRLADENKCRSVAFPSISTGVYRFPLDRAAAIVAKTFVEYFTGRPETCVERVVMVCFDQKTFEAYEKAFDAIDDSK